MPRGRFHTHHIYSTLGPFTATAYATVDGTEPSAPRQIYFGGFAVSGEDSVELQLAILRAGQVHRRHRFLYACFKLTFAYP